MKRRSFIKSVVGAVAGLLAAPFAGKAEKKWPDVVWIRKTFSWRFDLSDIQGRSVIREQQQELVRQFEMELWGQP